MLVGYFFGQVGGWVGAEMEIKATSAKVEVEVEGELGNNILQIFTIQYVFTIRLIWIWTTSLSFLIT